MNTVVPYIGTWIETETRGTKAKSVRVVPYIGTWIETISESLIDHFLGSYLI